MTDRPRDGVPSVEELIGYTLLIADCGQKSFEDCQLVREETRRALKTFETTNKTMVEDVAAQADYLKKLYAPAAVQATAEESQTAVREFKVELDDVRVKLRRTIARFAVCIAIIAVLGSAAAPSAVWLSLRRVPTLTEIADRQAQLQGLQDQVNAFSSQIESLKGHLVRDPEGQWYARYDGHLVNLCRGPNPNENCGPYVPIPK